MRIHSKDFRAEPHGKFKLSEWSTKVKPFYADKDDYKKRLADHNDELSAQQDLFYANHCYSLLIIFQAMDAGGKDSAIEHVMSGVNPQGCNVTSFKHPSEEELDHDFLWRCTEKLPKRGMIGIFNRSYYEEVLITRVHPKILKAENLPPSLTHEKDIWKGRFKSITDFESHLHRNATRVVKIFLHLSKEEQKHRFLKRIDHAEKNWKFAVGDIEERKYWNEYQRVYGDCIRETTAPHAPWYVVPADDKPNARLIVAQIILDALRGFELTPPSATKEQKKALAEMRKKL
ncbi:MAG: ADP-polyphosphate phosphotransferase [Polyangiaceae bacterium]